MGTDMTVTDRKNLRAVVRSRFKTLRMELAGHEQALTAEVENELAMRYAGQDEDIRAYKDAKQEARRRKQEAYREADKIEEAEVAEAARVLKEKHPGMVFSYGDAKGDERRSQIRRAALSAIPGRLAATRLELQKQESELIERLTVDDIKSNDGQAFLEMLPTPERILSQTSAGKMLEIGEKK